MNRQSQDTPSDINNLRAGVHPECRLTASEGSGKSKKTDSTRREDKAMTMNKIELFLLHNQWHGRFSGPLAARMEKLFGKEALIPIPWTGDIDCFEVRDRVAALNPGFEVMVVLP